MKGTKDSRRTAAGGESCSLLSEGFFSWLGVYLAPSNPYVVTIIEHGVYRSTTFPPLSHILRSTLC